ncbi:hypothetical protein DID76_04035 [Candidatus Marinamargulisbacteria bacterium SCGC AG-414-C22]|nr:hypothetical protein DID76_04035 [Candidatus Marinamargulisbacteria bacterium SCGC AG-414-C22]
MASEKVNMNFDNTLTILRGQAFFTYGFTVTNNKGIKLLMLADHYDRLAKSYREMFELPQLPFSYDEFKAWVSDTLTKNNNQNQYGVTIMLCGGTARIMNETAETYVNNFGGTCTQLIILVKPFTNKPQWSFNQGIHLISFPYQRTLAQSKPTNYLGGIKGQFIIDTINMLCVLTQLSQTTEPQSVTIQDQVAIMDRVYQLYMSLPPNQQDQLRLFCNEARQSHASLQPVYEKFVKEVVLEKNVATYLSQLNWNIASATLLAQETALFPGLLHDCVFHFPKDPNLLLEGSTFSVMGIDQDDQLIFPALDHQLNQENVSIENSDGKLLESTTILCLLKVAQQLKLPYKIKKIDYKLLATFKTTLAISSTRLFWSPAKTLLQPIASINGKWISRQPLSSIDIYNQWIAGINAFISNYEYEAAVNAAAENALVD